MLLGFTLQRSFSLGQYGSQLLSGSGLLLEMSASIVATTPFSADFSRVARLLDGTRRYSTTLGYSTVLDRTRPYSTTLEGTRAYSTVLDDTRGYSRVRLISGNLRRSRKSLKTYFTLRHPIIHQTASHLRPSFPQRI